MAASSHRAICMRQCLVYLCITSLWKACWSTALSSLSNVQQHQQQRNYLRSAPDADVGIEQLLIPSAIQTPPHQNRQQQQQQPDDDSPEEQRRKNCPSPEYSVFRCDDPTGDWILPCDRDTCEWDQSSLSPDQAPEFCLDFVTIDDPNEVDLPDEVKPCALWEIIHGVDNTPSPVPTLTPTLELTMTSQPTINNSTAPTLAPSVAESTLPTVMQSLTPSSAPPKDAPPTLTAAPSLDAVSFETVLLNFWIESAFDVAKKAFGTDKLQTELTSLTERHVLRHIRNVLKDTDGELVEAVVANISTVSLLYPWQNDTILATHTVTGAVRFYPSEQGPPRNEGVNAMVHNSFRSRGLLRFLIDFGEATDETLQQVYAIHVGLPSDVLPTVATTTKTDSDKTTTAEQDKSLKSKMKDEMEDWVGLVDWGNWEALSFILFVSISGFLFLLCSTCIFGIGCRRRRRIRREKMFAEIHGTNSSTDTEALTPATEHEKDSEKPNGNSQTTLPEKDPYDAYFTHPVVTVGYPLLSGSMDAHDAAMEQCSLADGTVDAIVLSRMKNHDIDDDMASSLSNGSVGRSDVTSVYSYIENKSMMLDDDPNFSFGAAIATNPTGSADDDISTGWSVPGVNTTGMSYAYGLDTNMGLTSRVSPETPTKDDMANPSDTSLRGVSTSASTHEGSNLLIFCDGTADDSLSLINDSVILSALDNFNDDFDNGPTIPSIGEKMTTNSRVAAVVANLEAKLDSSTDSQMAKSLEGKGKSLNYSGITDARTPPNDKTSSQPDRRSPSSSVVSRRVSDEGDRSAAESVSLASYTAAPYKNDRKSIMPKAEVETEPTVVLDTIDKAGHANPTLGKPSSMPPKARAQSDGLTPANDADSEDVAQQKSRGRSVSPVKAVARPSWGVPKPSSDAIPPRNRSQYLHQQQVESTAKALAFWNKSSSGRSSKASQQALNALNTPSKFPDFSPPFTESRASPYHRSPEPDIVNQSYQESESDIQSICSYDDRSQFSFAKRSVAPDSSHHNALGNNTTSLLGSRLPSSSMDGSEEYNLQSANQ